ncbi:MAG: SRPBCC family protein [Actinomycetota bacterium]
MKQETRKTGTNALRHELTSRVDHESSASAEDVYEVLSDLRTHAVWGGERQSPTTRIVSIEAPEDEAVLGTEFESTGTDPMGRFSDRSVVTAATRPSVFEFVTQARLETKKGARADWTNVHRYELRASGDGCVIAYTIRIVSISALPGMLRVLNLPLLSGLVMKASASVARRGVENLARMAEERANAR